MTYFEQYGLILQYFMLVREVISRFHEEMLKNDICTQYFRQNIRNGFFPPNTVGKKKHLSYFARISWVFIRFPSYLQYTVEGV